MKFCTNCGKEIQDDARFCPSCGTCTSAPSTPYTPKAKQVCPDTHFALALISTLMFCLPLGIISVIMSSRVTTEFNRGNYEAAVQASKNAEKWGIISIIAGASLIIGLVILYLLYFGFLFLLIEEDILY